MRTPLPTAAGFSRSRVACLLAAGYVAVLGSWVLTIGLLAWAYQLKESATIVGILLTAQMLPAFLLGPVAARLGTGRHTRTLFVAAQALAAVTLLPLLEADSNAGLPVALTVALLSAIPITFARETHRALLPDPREPERLLARVVPGARFAGMPAGPLWASSLCLVVGPAAGTAILQGGGLRGSAIVTIGALLLSALLALLAGSPVPATTTTRPRLPATIALAELQQGLLRLRSHPELQTVTALWLAVELITGGLVVSQIAFTVWGLTISADNLGFVLAAQGLGVAAGLPVYAALRKRFTDSTLVAFSLGLMSMAQFGFVASPSLRPAAAFSALAGLGAVLAIATLVSLVSDRAERQDPGLVAGLAMAAEVAALLSAIALGPLVDGISPRYALSLASILVMLLALYAYGTVEDRSPEGSESRG